MNRIITGTKRITEWWINGAEPVGKGVAEHRASICVKCQKNESSHLFESLTGSLAKWVKRAFEMKSSMTLKTSFDERLNICGACGCELQLKVWEPMEMIRKQMTSEEMEALDARCWIKP